MSEVVYTLPPVVELGTLLDCYRDDPVMTHQKWVQWAVDCAERVLPLFEARHPNDARPRQALDAARAWVAHPTVENRNAANAAANAAAYAAANAAHAAEKQWQAIRLMAIYHGDEA